jgi:hypothetical protein
MKTIFSLVAIVCILATTSFAAKRTVDNSPLSAAQYSDIPAALTASTAGDTIYVYGSPYTYTNITIDKKITLVGSGGFPQVNNESAPKISQVIFTTGSDNSVITGFEITNILYAGYSTTVNNVWVFNNKFSGQYGVYVYGNATNWIIEGNAFIQYTPTSSIELYSGTWTNWMIKNNYFETYYDYGINFRSINSSITVRNNVFFFGLNYAYNYQFLYSGSGGLFENNIIKMASGQTTIDVGCPACVFNNNLIYNANGNIATPTNGSNNIMNTAPVYTSLANLATGYSVNNNYSLPTGAPGKAAGTDGTDLGLYGGNFKWNNRLYPKLFPHQEIFNVINQSVPQGTPVNIQFKARKAFN